MRKKEREHEREGKGSSPQCTKQISGSWRFSLSLKVLVTTLIPSLKLQKCWDGMKMNATHLQQSSAHTVSKCRQAHCIIRAARAPDRWMIYAHSQKNRRACRGDSRNEAVARQMLSAGVWGLAAPASSGATWTPKAELLLPGFQHSDVPFARWYAIYTANTPSTRGKYHIHATNPPSPLHIDVT